jgi:hypothetical protein
MSHPQGALHQVDRAGGGHQALAFGTPGPERSIDSMRRDKVAQLAARRPVSLVALVVA